VGDPYAAAAEEREAVERDLHHARRIDLDELAVRRVRRPRLLIIDADLAQHDVRPGRTVVSARAVGRELPQRALPGGIGRLEVREELLTGRDADIARPAIIEQRVRD